MIGVLARPTARRRPPWAFTAGAVVTAAVLGVAIVKEPLVVALVVPGVAVVLIVVAVTRYLTASSDARLRRWVTGWTLAAFAIHLAAGIVILSSPTLISYFGGDATTYSTGALGIFQHWTQGGSLPTNLPAGKTGFYYMLAALFFTFGVHAQAGMIVNAAMAALVVPLLCDATYRHFGPAAVRAVPVMATLLPGFLIWGSQLLREAGVYFFMAVAINCAVRLLHRTSLTALLMMVGAIALMVTFRADVALVAGGALAIAITVGRRNVGGGLASGLGAVALVLALVLGGGLGYSGYRFVTHASFNQVNNIRADSSQSASSGFLQQGSVSTANHAASYIPLGTTYFMLGPAPWQIRGGRQLFSIPDVLVWWALLPSLWRGIREAKRRRGREIVVYVLPALALTIVLALIIANFGTAVRERMQVVVILVPLIGLGWSVRHPGRAAGQTPAALGDRVTTSGATAQLPVPPAR